MARPSCRLDFPHNSIELRREYQEMIRRILIGGSTALLLTGLMFGRDAVSYVRTSVGWVKDSVADSVPVEFQIERARKLIDDLEPEVRRNKHLIVREEVALEALARQVAESGDEADSGKGEPAADADRGESGRAADRVRRSQLYGRPGQT